MSNTDIGELYTYHSRWLKSWFHLRLRCSETASDLAHDIFIRLLTQEQPLLIGEPKAFLTTAAKRTLSNYWRREKIEEAYLATLASKPEAYEISAEERSVMIEALVEIDKMFDGLPVVVRRAFFYAQLDGLKHSDIASKLDISVSTVKRHIHQAAMQCYFATNV